ncbi:uncharacterized protein G2W53_038562 [Senna tora]|uniref:Uncharacterized protein n=1 Tax=Senna tora TaxID=362788 RepID=A0A834SMT1_9FABA|nr:uncharacterized protein G2W53_038562 [Senna tora]
MTERIREYRKNNVAKVARDIAELLSPNFHTAAT